MVPADSKKNSVRINLDGDLGVLGQRIGHVQVTAVKAKLGHARRDAGLRRLVFHLRGGDKGITGRSATLFSHWNLSGNSCGDCIAAGGGKAEKYSKNKPRLEATFFVRRCCHCL